METMTRWMKVVDANAAQLAGLIAMNVFLEMSFPVRVSMNIAIFVQASVRLHSVSKRQSVSVLLKRQ